MIFYIYISARCLRDVCDVTGVMNSVRTRFPCYMCTATRDLLHDFRTRFPLRHNALIEHHVAAMRGLLVTEGVAAMKEYSNPISDRCLPDFQCLITCYLLLADICWISARCPRCLTAGRTCSVAMVDVVFRRFLDFDAYIGTPIDILHNMESGIMKDMLEVYSSCRIHHRCLPDVFHISVTGVGVLHGTHG